jgi:hypothetical protein
MQFFLQVSLFACDKLRLSFAAKASSPVGRSTQKARGGPGS